MDLKKAMRLLGFPCDQSFAKTDIDQIEKAFLTQSKKVMNESKEELRNSKMQKSKKLKAKKEEDMKNEITQIYEALQFLTEKKNKKQNIKAKWKIGSHKNDLVSKVLSALKNSDGNKRNGAQNE